jgi:DNA-binding GntR family transcriptional regulator
MIGELAPGQRLKAEELAVTWGVSPTPVREALQRLTALGLVRSIPNRGMRVADVAAGEMHEVYGIRLLLEPFALRLSLENRDDEFDDAVRQAFAPLEKQLLASHSDVFAFEQVHRTFHQALLRCCDCNWLTRIIETLRTHSVRYRLLTIGPRGGREDVLKEHRDLLVVCLEGAVDEAVERLFDHIRLTVDSLGGGEIPAQRSSGDRLMALMTAAGKLMHPEAAV